MGLDGWAAIAERHRRTMVLVALVSTFAGVGLLIDRPKGTVLEWLAIPFLVAGVAVFAWAVWPRGIAVAASKPSLAQKLLGILTLRGRLVPYFPAIGAAILALDVAYNLVIASTATFGTEDTIVILAAAALIGYGFVPSRFARERDFVLVFFLALVGILVVPLLVARAFYQDFERSVDMYSWVALAPETSAVLSLLGVSNTVHAVVGSTAPGITFVPRNLGIPVTAVITTACSGIYSFGIFASAFIAFVLTEYAKPSKRIWALLGLGFLASYVANVLRMVVIVLVGYYTDTAQTDLQNMLIAHSYAGWIIFLAWVALFWGILLRFLPKERDEERAATPRLDSKPSETRCSACHEILTPAIPATRCRCGAYYHRACVVADGQCVRCKKRIEATGTIASTST